MNKYVKTAVLILGAAAAASCNSAFASEDFDVNAWREKNWKKFEEFREEGIPEDKIYGVGTEGMSSSFPVGITVKGYEFEESIYDVEEQWFFDYEAAVRAADEEGKLYPYQRQTVRYDWKTGEILEVIAEETASRELLTVDVEIINHSQEEIEAPVYGSLVYIEKSDGRITWADPWVAYLPAEEEGFESLQTDNRNIGFSDNPEDKNWCVLQPEEAREFELVFVVDVDRKDDILIEFGALGNDLINGEKNIDGYYSLD